MHSRIDCKTKRRRLLLPALAMLHAPLAVGVIVPGPPGSGVFGQAVTVLPNGNVLVRDPEFDLPGGPLNVGAVYLYRDDGVLISRLTGSTADDGVGSFAVVLANGNVVVESYQWNNGAQTGAGAVTFIDADTGLSGTVSAANSLIGTRAGDLASDNVELTVPLPNGNYLVRAPSWDIGPVLDVGAVVFGNGETGVRGEISAANALVGSSASDQVGAIGSNFDAGPVVLSNGNYIVATPGWNNGAAADVGAFTWGSGTTGIVGAISPTNSLVGVTALDGFGGGATALSNGHAVVRAPQFDLVGTGGTVANVGIAVWMSGTQPTVGVLSAANGIVGSTANDTIGSRNTVALTNGNFVVRSPNWDNGTVVNAGAATWASGSGPTSLVVGAANSLVGTAANDNVSAGGVTALTNGNYVVRSNGVDLGGVANVGAATFGNGATGSAGTISATNSLVGATANDGVGLVLALTNGNYVVATSGWDNGTVANVGAITWGNGTSGTIGVVSAANSRTGSTAGDLVGGGPLVALPGGRFATGVNRWDNGAIVDAGMAFVAEGTAPFTGPITPANALVGSTANDRVGGIVLGATDGTVIVASFGWDGPGAGAVDIGAITFYPAATPRTGPVSLDDSLVGVSADSPAQGSIDVYDSGDLVLAFGGYDAPGAEDAGAVIRATTSDPPVGGTIADFAPIVGPAALAAEGSIVAFDPTSRVLVIGRPAVPHVEIIGNRLFSNSFEPPPAP